MSYWDLERVYKLSANDPRIKWDAENVFAIRVYDRGGPGGIYSGGQSISMVKRGEYLTLNYKKVQFKYSNDSITKSLILGNSSSALTLSGKFTITAVSKLDGQITYNKSYEVILKPDEKKEVNFTLSKQDHSNYITYRFDFKGNEESVSYSEESPYILTPAVSNKPKINGAKIYGERAGKPFLFLVATSGARPMEFSAGDLPFGLRIDKAKGIITGKANTKGIYDVLITAKNKYGEAKEYLKIVIGDQVALTPPMGWNSWNC